MHLILATQKQGSTHRTGTVGALGVGCSYTATPQEARARALAPRRETLAARLACSANNANPTQGCYGV